MTPTTTRAIWWLKKDFRLHDNPALCEALATYDQVIALFCFEPSVLTLPETSAFHIAAQHEALAELRLRLKAAGADLVCLHAEVCDALDSLMQAAPFDAIYSHEEVGTLHTYGRDVWVKSWCDAHGVQWHERRQTGVFRGLKDRDDRSKLWREFIQEPALKPPASLDKMRLGDLPNLDLPPIPSLKSLGFELTEAQLATRQSVTESAAEGVLTSFLHARGRHYNKLISSPNTAFEHGSRLSVHLAWGTITGRRVYQALEARRAQIKTGPKGKSERGFGRALVSFRSRLHWRDHFTQRLESAADMELFALHPSYEELYGEPDAQRLKAWCEGMTGFPMVDACVRCARTTGFLNFRMRAMLTSFGCHVLKLDWRALHEPMARMWADYEPGIHLSQLQMQAGVVGLNTLRIYSPKRQIETQDPEAEFVKRWVPELRDFDVKEILAHHDEPLGLGDYPDPIVDYAAEVKAMRSAYFSIKGRSETKAITPMVLQLHGSRRGPSKRRQKKKMS